MGCWNGTCAISTLPILYAERIRIVFLQTRPRAQADSGAGFCYSTGIWMPVSMAIPGHYDDYGAIEKEDPTDWRVTMFLEWLKERLVEQEQGPNPVHDKPIRRDKIETINDICRHIHAQGDRVFVNDPVERSMWASVKHASEKDDRIPDPGEYVPPRLGYCLIREDIYQGIVETPYQDWRGNNLRVEDHYAEMRKWMEETLQILVKEDDPNFAILRLMIGDSIWSQGEAGIFPLRDFRDRFLFELQALKKEGKDLEAFAEEVLWPRLQAIVRLRWVNWMMDNARLHWSPQTGAGSQSEDYQIQQDLLDIKQKALTGLRERREQDEEDEE